MSFIAVVKLFVDGGSRGNPGPGAIGVLILNEDNQELDRYRKCIGHSTNNEAEYRALIEGLRRCAKYTRKRVEVFTDSQLVYKQMTGSWRVKKDHLLELVLQAKDHEKLFEEVVYTHVRRENPYMRKVDRLLKEALEGR